MVAEGVSAPDGKSAANGRCTHACGIWTEVARPPGRSEILTRVTRSPPVTVGELFPADDLVAQWVFALSAVAEDLAITEAAFQDVLHDDSAPLWTGYYYRQVIARLYEAERPIISARQRDDVRAFLAEIPEAAEHIDYLADLYVAADGQLSKVRATFGGMRHRTVHHSWVGSAELREALEAAAGEDARILVNRNERWLHHEWPEAVALRSLLGDLTAPEANAAFRERLKLVQDMLRHLVALVKVVIAEHISRRGIDPSRLIVEVTADEPGRPARPDRKPS
jgi:hypothetical protein